MCSQMAPSTHSCLAPRYREQMPSGLWDCGAPGPGAAPETADKACTWALISGRHSSLVTQYPPGLPPGWG